MTASPPYALLADIDGPLSNPDAKRITQPGIIPDLARLLSEGVPVVLNTGRTAADARRLVIDSVLASKPWHLDRLFAICEKGAIWLRIAPDGGAELNLDASISVPAGVETAVRTLAEAYADTMYVDDEKIAMVSLERRLDTSQQDYTAAQERVVEEAFDRLVGLGYGVCALDRQRPDAEGRITLRIDPTLIATDIESPELGKDRGAERAVLLLRHAGVEPQRWVALGDSASDYAMADWLHAHKYDVTYVDVGAMPPSGERPYAVIRIEGLVNDAAGAAYLRSLVRRELA